MREALRLLPGDGVEFGVDDAGQIVVRKAGSRASGGGVPGAPSDRFEAARGKAQVKSGAPMH